MRCDKSHASIPGPPHRSPSSPSSRCAALPTATWNAFRCCSSGRSARGGSPSRCACALRRHRRELQVVGPHLVPEPQRELYYSCRLGLPVGARGGAAARSRRAERRGARRSARRGLPRPRGEPAGDGVMPVVLGPAAAAVFLHEAVAHALEADTLALGGPSGGGARGRPSGRRACRFSTIPGPPRRCCAAAATTRARRSCGDGCCAPASSSNCSPTVAGVRSRRGSSPVPDAVPAATLPMVPALELPAADAPASSSFDDLFAGSATASICRRRVAGRSSRSRGLFAAPAAWPAHPRRCPGGAGRRRVCCRARRRPPRPGVGLADDRVLAGAGWCAKGGQRLPVWAQVPPLALDGVEVAA